jgi:hypothetical protein
LPPKGKVWCRGGPLVRDASLGTVAGNYTNLFVRTVNIFDKSTGDAWLLLVILPFDLVKFGNSKENDEFEP